MIVGEVVGNVWGTRKHPSLCKSKLLLVRPIDPLTQKPIGKAVLALDPKFGSGPGSIVLLIDEGGSARQILEDKTAPVRTIVAGIIDSVQINGKEIRYA